MRIQNVVNKITIQFKVYTVSAIVLSVQPMDASSLPSDLSIPTPPAEKEMLLAHPDGTVVVLVACCYKTRLEDLEV